MRARSARWRPRTRPRRWLCFLAVLLLACLASCGVQAGATVLAETQGHEAFDDAAAAAIVAHAALGNTAACAAVASAGARCIAQRRRRDELDKGRFSLQRAKAKGVADDDIASATHAANNSLEFSLGADRIAKRPRLGVNPQAVAGASRKRAVRPGEPLRAGQRAVPRLTKTNGGKDKKRAKLTVVVNGPLTEKDTQAAEVAKKASAAKAAQLAASGRVSATFAATAGAACASARVKRKASGA